jgi:tetratricopeptide (TPR) repeat protein
MSDMRIILSLFIILSVFVFGDVSDDSISAAEISSDDLCNKGLSLFADKDYEQASGYCINALKIDPESNFALSMLGETYLKMGRYENALTVLLQLEKKEMKDPCDWTKRLLAEAYVNLKDCKNALIKVQEAKQIICREDCSDHNSGKRILSLSTVEARCIKPARLTNKKIIYP